MKGSLTLEQLAAMALTLIGVSVGIGIIYSADSGSQEIHPVESAVKNSDYPACQEFSEDETINREGLRTIIYGRYLNVCEKKSNNLTTGFKLEKQDVEKIAEDLSNTPQVIQRNDCSKIPGFNGIIVEDTGTEPLSPIGGEIQVKGNKPTVICQR